MRQLADRGIEIGLDIYAPDQETTEVDVKAPNPPPEEVVAERELYAIAADDRSFKIRIAVGKPYRVREDEWACAVRLSGLHSNLSDIHGNDSWQALQLAQQLAAQLLGYFVQDGGRLYWEKDGEQIQIPELFVKGLPSNAIQHRPPEG